MGRIHCLRKDCFKSLLPSNLCSIQEDYLQSMNVQNHGEREKKGKTSEVTSWGQMVQQKLKKARTQVQELDMWKKLGT